VAYDSPIVEIHQFISARQDRLKPILEFKSEYDIALLIEFAQHGHFYRQARSILLTRGSDRGKEMIHTGAFDHNICKNNKYIHIYHIISLKKNASNTWLDRMFVDLDCTISLSIPLFTELES